MHKGFLLTHFSASNLPMFKASLKVEHILVTTYNLSKPNVRASDICCNYRFVLIKSRIITCLATCLRVRLMLSNWEKTVKDKVIYSCSRGRYLRFTHITLCEPDLTDQQALPSMPFVTKPSTATVFTQYSSLD